MNYFIYLLTNKINEKIYVGQSKDVNQRWRHHKASVKNNRPTQIVHHAMIKYGLDNFVFEVIAGCKTQEDINWAEEYFINYYDSINNGYNLTNGGCVAPKTEEWKRKVSEKLMGHEVTQETRDKVSKGNTGKIRSDEFKKDVGDFWRGKERTKEHRENLSKSLTGNKLSEETKQKISISGKGRVTSEETKKKISEKSKLQEKRYAGKSWKIIDGRRVWIDKIGNI